MGNTRVPICLGRADSTGTRTSASRGVRDLLQNFLFKAGCVSQHNYIASCNADVRTFFLFSRPAQVELPDSLALRQLQTGVG